MKYSFLFGVFILWSICALGQASHATLTGTLIMATGEEFPYKIDISDSNGYVVGVAYTYNAPDQTKVLIAGKIDKQRRRLSFKETEIRESHSVQTKAFMCLLHTVLEYKQGVLTGPVNSMESDNTACTPGTLTFGKVDEINTLFSSDDKYDVVINMGGHKDKPKPVVTEEAKPAAEIPQVTDKVTAGVEKTYEWVTDSLVVEVWDGGNFDGDVVTIEFDGKPVLKHFMIDKSKKRIKVNVASGSTHTLAIIADNEGSDPPNTASLTLTDGTKNYSLLAYNEKGNQSMIRIKRVK